jgi:hypothetical protein
MPCLRDIRAVLSVVKASPAHLTLVSVLSLLFLSSCSARFIPRGINIALLSLKLLSYDHISHPPSLSQLSSPFLSHSRSARVLADGQKHQMEHQQNVPEVHQESHKLNQINQVDSHI